MSTSKIENDRVIVVSSENDLILKKGMYDLFHELSKDNITEEEKQEILKKYNWLNELFIK